jgi:hypothetical protein
VIWLKSQSDLAFASSGCFFRVHVITDTSEIPCAKILDPCTDHKWWIFSCQFFHHDVEPVDSLSIDEAYESIGVDMPDHDRRPSCVHLHPCVPMNTRRCARVFRG